MEENLFSFYQFLREILIETKHATNMKTKRETIEKLNEEIDRALFSNDMEKFRRLCKLHGKLVITNHLNVYVHAK